MQVVLLRSGVDSISPSIVDWRERERMLIESLRSSRKVHAYGRGVEAKSTLPHAAFL